MPLTQQDFVSKWKRMTSREKQTYQEHFIDLCRLVDHPTLNEAVFTTYGCKSELWQFPVFQPFSPPAAGNAHRWAFIDLSRITVITGEVV